MKLLEVTRLKTDYRQLRRVIVEHEIAPATLLSAWQVFRRPLSSPTLCRRLNTHCTRSLPPLAASALAKIARIRSPKRQKNVGTVATLGIQRTHQVPLSQSMRLPSVLTTPMMVFPFQSVVRRPCASTLPLALAPCPLSSWRALPCWRIEQTSERMPSACQVPASFSRGCARALGMLQRVQ